MPKCIDTVIRTIDGEECLNQSLAKINDNFAALDELVCTLKEKVDTRQQVRTFFYYGPNAQVAPASGLDNYRLSRPSNETIESFVNSPAELDLTAISKPGDIAYVIYQKSGFRGTLPSQSSGFNPETGSPEIYTSGRSVLLNMNTWYNVDDYYSVTGSVELGSTPTAAEPSNAGTIILKFKSPSGEISEYTYGGSGDANNVVIEWDPESILWSEEDPVPRIIKGVISRPFKNVPGTQFLFTATGFYESSTLGGFIKKTSQVPAVDFSVTTADLINEYSPTFIIWKLKYLLNGYLVELGFPKFSKALGSGTNWNNPETWTTYNSVDAYTPGVLPTIAPLSDQLYVETVQGLNRQVQSTSDRLAGTITPQIPPSNKIVVVKDGRTPGGGGGRSGSKRGSDWERRNEQRGERRRTGLVEEWGKSGSEQSSGGGGKKGSSGSVEKQRAKKTAESVNKIEEKIVRPLETTKKKSEHYNSSSGTKSSRPSGITKKQTNLSKVESTSVTNDKNLHEAKQKLKKHFENENIRTGGKIKDDLTRRQKIAEKDLEQRYIKKRKENPNDPWNLGGNTQSPYGPEYY